MLVRDFMTSNVVTVGPETPASHALDLMRQQHIRRLPVLRGKTLLGIVTWADLLHAAPRPAAPRPGAPALAARDATAKEVMSRNPITVGPDVTIEETAVLMREHKIGALPVLDHGALVGIITESDVFDAFIQVMGLRSGGARLTIKQADGGASLEGIVKTVRDCHAGVLSLTAYRMHGSDWVVVRVDAPIPLHVVQTLVERGINVTHLAPLPGRRADESG